MLIIAKFFIKNYKFTFVVFIFFIIFGVGGLLRLNSESYPAVNFAMATITTPYDGASAEEIEIKITKKIEDEVRTVSGLKDVRSTSQSGLSSIFVRADIDNIDVKEVMGELQRAVDRVSDLPPDLRDKPKFLEIKSEEFPAIEITVVGSNKNRARDLVAESLKEEIEDNKSVLNVRIPGFRKRVFDIELDAQALKNYHVGIDEVIQKIQARNINSPGGKIEKTSDQKLLRLEAKVSNIDDLKDLVVRSTFSGSVIRLSDIAEIKDSEETAKVLTQYNGEDSTLLIVNKKGGADTIDLVNDIYKTLDSFKELYAGEFEFIIYNNEANRVKQKLSILSSNAVTGLMLVMFFLLIFLPGRIGLVASLSLPLCVLATVGFIPGMDMNLNAVTILALVIALGMLVDNSVVISENYARLRQEGMGSHEAALESIRQLWVPITGTAFTTIAAFMPMLVTKGIMGQFIKFIPIIVSISLLVSLFESMFLLPMRLVVTDSPKAVKVVKAEGEAKGMFLRFSKWFESFTRMAVRFRYFSCLVYIGLLTVSVVMMSVFNRMELFPSNQTEIFLARVELKSGSTIDQTHDAMSSIVKQIHENASVHINHIVSRAGASSMGPMDPKAKDGTNVGIIMIYVNDHMKFEVEDRVLLEKARNIKLPDTVSHFTVEAMTNGPPVGEPVNVTFRSNNEKQLSAALEILVAKLSAIDGFVDVTLDDEFGNDEVFILLDYVKIDRLGLDARSVGNAVRSAVSGKNISNVNLNNKDVDLFIRIAKKDRLSVDTIKTLEVMDRRGNLIPLSSIARFERHAGAPKIKRFDYKRSKTLISDLNLTKLTSIEANQIVIDEFDKIKKEFPEVSYIFGGEGKNTQESLESLFNALVLSLICIFALLVLMFNSYISPFIIMSTIPLGLVGFSISFALHNEPISFLAMIGLIGLGGIIVNSGIILISFIDELKEAGGSTLEDVLAVASRIRLRAVVVSSLTTISGLMPTAYGIGGSDAFLMPMTLAMAWGLTSGTILTLVWIPCAYAIKEDFTALMSRIRSRIFK